jgi:hypothetical protein
MAEGELVEIGLQVLRRHRARVRAQEPAIQERDGPVADLQGVGSRGEGQGRRSKGGMAMIVHIIAMFEALTASDLEAARPADLERFAGLCRHWASLADLSRETRGNPSVK